MLLALPASFLGLIAGHFAFRSLLDFPAPVGIGMAAAMSAFASVIAFTVIWTGAGLWQYFNPAVVLPAALLGFAGAIILLIFKWSFPGSQSMRP